MPEKNLDTLFHDTLKDIYFAEKAITKALPKMAKAAQSDELRNAFTTHLEQTKGHVGRLEQVFELMGKKPQSKPCEAIKGIVKEGDEIAEDYADSRALDAGLLAAAQAVEHYEISRYGTLNRCDSLSQLAVCGWSHIYRERPRSAHPPFTLSLQY